MKHDIFTRRIESLTKDLFSLEEPWRSRFLELVANETMDWEWEGQSPTQEEVATWLSDGDLHQKVMQILNAWQRNG